MLSKWILLVIKYKKLALKDIQVWPHTCSLFSTAVTLIVCNKLLWKENRKERKKTWGNIKFSLRKSFCHSSFILCQIKAFSLWPRCLLINTSLRTPGLVFSLLSRSGALSHSATPCIITISGDSPLESAVGQNEWESMDMKYIGVTLSEHSVCFWHSKISHWVRKWNFAKENEQWEKKENNETKQTKHVQRPLAASRSF